MMRSPFDIHAELYGPQPRAKVAAKLAGQTALLVLLGMLAGAFMLVTP